MLCINLCISKSSRLRKFNVAGVKRLTMRISHGKLGRQCHVRRPSYSASSSSHPASEKPLIKTKLLASYHQSLNNNDTVSYLNASCFSRENQQTFIFTGRQHSLLRTPCTSHRRDVCPSVCLSVTRWHCVKTTQARITKSSPTDSPRTL